MDKQFYIIKEPHYWMPQNNLVSKHILELRRGIFLNAMEKYLKFKINLGGGGLSAIYRAVELTSDDIVILKQYLKPRFFDPESKKIIVKRFAMRSPNY